MKTTLYLLVLAVAFTAGIHAALVPEHLREMPPLGVAFIVSATCGLVLAGALLALPRPWVVPLAGAFLAFEIVAWVAFVTVPVPGFSGTPEPVEAIAVVCKAIEAAGLVLSIRLTAGGRRRAARGRGLAAGDRGLVVGDRGLAVGDRGLAVGDRGLAVGDRGLAVGDRGLAPGDRGLAAGAESTAAV